jgi:DNA-binding CsgD family transcriptional regulator
MLVGRSAECGALDRLLEGGRTGRSGAIVLRGEPGVGKTALLDHAAEQANGMRVLRGTGIETESELAFAALHQLLARDLQQLDALPGPQAEALRGAFGLAPAEGTDPFLISLGLLSVLAELAEATPVLCLIDDAQWLDEPSALALLFTARRIEAEGIVMIFAVREGEERGFEAHGLRSLAVEGLDETAAAELLDQRVGNGLAPAVRERLVSATAGNALALLELPATLTPEQLTGREPLAEPLPIGVGLEAAYLSRLRRLPAATQSLLLFAAAEDSGELAAVLRAAASDNIELEALGPAERDGLVSVRDGHLAFRHPLVRSAIYRGATFSERQHAHSALADALDGSNPDREAWHRAAAAEGPDEHIARGLEASAERAARRGGHAVAASALEKAAGLSPDESERTRRLLGAADAAWTAGRSERARALLDEAGRLAPQELRVDVTKLRGRIEVRSGVFEEACAALLNAAQELATSQPATALQLLEEAEEATLYTGDVETIVRIGKLTEQIAANDPAVGEGFVGLMLIGVGRLFTEGIDAAAPLLRRGLELARESDNVDHLLVGGRIGMQLGEDEVAFEVVSKAVRIARENGAVGVLPVALARIAFGDWRVGRYSSARIHASESLRLAREMGQETGLALGVLALVAGVQGREDECRASAHEAIERAYERRAGILRSLAAWGVGLLELGLGRYHEALRILDDVVRREDALAHPGMRRFMTPDYVEAAVRTGERDGVDELVEEFGQWAFLTGRPWVQALHQHCLGLTSEGAAGEEHFLRALELHPVSRGPYERARTDLALGEALRRSRKRRQSREHLRSAMSGFEQLDAAPWEERARNELRASGETARKRDPSTLGDLTPQELQIARLVAAGSRNREVAAQLFLSPRTIDYHLRKVFMKLGISSRAELSQLDIVGAVT